MISWSLKDEVLYLRLKSREQGLSSGLRSMARNRAVVEFDSYVEMVDDGTDDESKAGRQSVHLYRTQIKLAAKLQPTVG